MNSSQAEEHGRDLLINTSKMEDQNTTLKTPLPIIKSKRKQYMIMANDQKSSQLSSVTRSKRKCTMNSSKNHFNCYRCLSPISNSKSNQEMACPICNHMAYNKRELNNVFYKLCRKHSTKSMYTCLVHNCFYVFTQQTFFIKHYRQHLDLGRSDVICSECFSPIRNCPRRSIKSNHIHQNTADWYVCCNLRFNCREDFILHKFNKHPAIVVNKPIALLNYIKSDKPNKITLSASVHADNLNSTEIQSVNYPMSTENLNSSGIQLYTCTVSNCDKVFDCSLNNLDHFCEHSDQKKNVFICVICLYVSTDKNFYCDHKRTTIKCNQCDLPMYTLSKLATHKLAHHSSVVLCGPSKVPGCPYCEHYFSKPIVNFYENHQECILGDKKNVSKCFEPPTIQTLERSRREVLRRGILKCLSCSCSFYSLEQYINHSEIKHRNIIPLKESGILLCTICDHNFSCKDFADHLVLCIDTMRIDNSSTSDMGVYSCIHCMVTFNSITRTRFLVHFQYCKTFEEHELSDNTRIFSCKRCTFSTTKQHLCMKHAITECLYVQLLTKYAQHEGEKEEVENRLSNVNTLNLSGPSIVEAVSDDKDSIKRLRLLYEYFCRNCRRGFFSFDVFSKHLNQFSVRCRSSELRYCKLCFTDFLGDVEYQAHLLKSDLQSGNTRCSKDLSSSLVERVVKNEPTSGDYIDEPVYLDEFMHDTDSTIINNVVVDLSRLNRLSDFEMGDEDVQEPKILTLANFIETSCSFQEPQPSTSNYGLTCDSFLSGLPRVPDAIKLTNVDLEFQASTSTNNSLPSELREVPGSIELTSVDFEPQICTSIDNPMQPGLRDVPGSIELTAADLEPLASTSTNCEVNNYIIDENLVLDNDVNYDTLESDDFDGDLVLNTKIELDDDVKPDVEQL